MDFLIEPMAGPRAEILCVPVLTVDMELVSDGAGISVSHGLLWIILGLKRGNSSPVTSLRAAGSVRAGAQLIPACLCLFICSLAVSTSPHVS